jgi:protein-arginine kinase activator protein McsA
MTIEERELVWKALKTLYLKYAEAHCDVKALITILSLETHKRIPECEQKLETFRQQAGFYRECYAKFEAALPPIQQTLQDMREAELIALLEARPIPKDLN